MTVLSPLLRAAASIEPSATVRTRKQPMTNPVIVTAVRVRPGRFASAGGLALGSFQGVPTCWKLIHDPVTTLVPPPGRSTM